MAKGKQMAAKSYLILNLNYSNKKKKIVRILAGSLWKRFHPATNPLRIKNKHFLRPTSVVILC